MAEKKSAESNLSRERQLELVLQIVSGLRDRRIILIDEPRFLPGPGGVGRFWMPTLYERDATPLGSDQPARVAAAASKLGPERATYTSRDLPERER